MKAISVLIGALLVALLLAVMPVQANAQSPVPLQVDESGTFTNADYIIKVPVDWNGTLVVYARGYSFEVPPAAGGPPQTPGIEEALLGEGYAIAGSAYKGSGWAVKEGLQNTLALTNRFNGIVGKPGRTILYGTSMGSVIALNGIEKHPGIYDGALAACAVGAGAPRNWDGTLVLSLAYDVTFGWPESWGSVDNVRDEINFEAEVLPILGAQLAIPENFGKFEFMRLVNGLPIEGFYPPPPPPPARVPIPWLFLDMLFATQARAEVEQRAGGSPVQNLDHLYALTEAEKAYLASLGVDDADALLLEMNDRRVYDADRPARNYLEHNAD